MFGAQITNILNYDLETPLDVATKHGLDVSVAILRNNGGRERQSIIESIVEKKDNRRMYFLLKGLIDRRKFMPFETLLKAGFDPSGNTDIII